MLHSPELRATLRTLMQRGADVELSDDDFNALALSVFRHQFSLNLPYQRYCVRRGRAPETIAHWTEIPAVPTAAFKEVELVAGDAREARLAFRTSGTTRGAQQRGTHFVLDPSLYDASLCAGFERFVLQGDARMRLLSLVPHSTESPDSSLSYMVTQLIRELGVDGSDFYADASGGIGRDRLEAALREAETARTPVCLLGTTLAFVHWLEASAAQFLLPAGSRLMDTGGAKGAEREISLAELRRIYARRLGLPPELCINEYGMTEMCSQYYDAAWPTVDGRSTSVKQGAPWVRARVVDPDTLAPVAPGTTGILQHMDLANLDSVSAIQTEDLAILTADGFVLLGRAPGAPPRGCSIAMDMLLSDTRP